MELPLTSEARRPIEGWVQNRQVKLHYLHSLPGNPAKTPLVIIPGFAEAAEYWVRVMSSLAPRGCVAISLRGRGKSDAPETGYSFEDHVTDIEAVVEALDLRRFCLMGFSRGVTYGVGYASRHSDRIAGLILIDFSAHHHPYPSEWIEEFLSTSYYGKPGSEMLQPRVAWALQREGIDIPLSDQLSRFEFPILFLHGGQAGSLLATSAAERYRRLIRNGQVIRFEDSGHDLREPDYERFIGTLEAFLGDLDRSYT